ncbi:MAG: hypothetical protein QOF78_1788 [Phycisphaerales bacterium]|jgi:hypothetical protein|nr:hypothetical protein [Phycisphaerales bacterium]
MKTLVTLALVAMMVSVLSGCKASGEVDPHDSSSISLPR